MLKTMNAREGIKTYVIRAILNADCGLKTMNAREGIKTHRIVSWPLVEAC